MNVGSTGSRNAWAAVYLSARTDWGWTVQSRPRITALLVLAFAIATELMTGELIASSRVWAADCYAPIIGNSSCQHVDALANRNDVSTATVTGYWNDDMVLGGDTISFRPHPAVEGR